jgi:hypothetical protein
VNTHYAVISFPGDLGGEHPDPELRGHSPKLTLIAAGPEAFCWGALTRWTAQHPLRLWEAAEVVARDPSAVQVC